MRAGLNPAWSAMTTWMLFGSLFSPAPTSSSPASRPGLRDSRPKALLALEAARERIVTARVDWLIRYRSQPQAQHVTGRFAEGDRSVIQRIDPFGHCGTDPVGDHLDRVTGALLTRRNENWNATTPMATRGPKSGSVAFDVRALDLSPLAEAASVHGAIWKNGIERAGAIEFTESQAEGLYLVTARGTNPATTMEQTWWLDPQKDWSPVKIQRRANGRIIAEMRATHAKYGERWFPRRILRYSGAADVRHQPAVEIVIENAQFNTPTLPRTLTISDLGVIVGGTIIDTQGSKPVVLQWDGNSAVSLEEFRERVKAGQIKPLPVSRAATAPHAAAGQNPLIVRIEENVLGAWDRYVADFAQSHRMTKEQRNAALGILADCKQKARHAMVRRRADFDEIALTRRQIEQMPVTAERTRKMTVLAHRETELSLATERLFRSELAPRLEGLLTAEQRVASEPKNPSGTEP